MFEKGAFKNVVCLGKKTLYFLNPEVLDNRTEINKCGNLLK